MLLRAAFLKCKFKYFVIVIIICSVLNVFGVFTHLFEHDYFKSFTYPYNGDVRKLVLQLRSEEKPDIEPINSYDYEYITECQEKCISSGNEVDVRLVYIIKSAPENFDRRLMIRNTWGFERRFSDVEIRTVFVLGVRNDDNGLQYKIDSEYNQFEDIVQADFIDAYFNNTIKTMMGMKWAINFCLNSKFYMFVDDDYYISTKNVLRFVRNPVNYPKYLEEMQTNNTKSNLLLLKAANLDLPNDVKLYAGYVFFSAPHRHFTSKWYVSINEYPYHLWPPYVTAGAYVLSHEALLEMYYTSFYTQHFKFDDIYMGLLAKKAQIEPFHCDNFYFYKQKYDVTAYRFTIASHGYDIPEELLEVWAKQKSLGYA